MASLGKETIILPTREHSSNSDLLSKHSPVDPNKLKLPIC